MGTYEEDEQIDVLYHTIECYITQGKNVWSNIISRCKIVIQQRPPIYQKEIFLSHIIFYKFLLNPSFLLYYF